MKKIGFIDYYISEWHANNYPLWIKELNGDYEVTHVWAELDVSPVDGVTTAQWCDKFGVIPCKSIDKLCQSCDCIVILAPSDPDKHLGYAKEALKHGKRTYIDKTFAPDYATASAIFDIAKRYGTPFFTTSALRFANELDEAKGADNFIITGGGSNFAEYCIHMIEMAVAVLKESVKSVKLEHQGDQRICSLETVNGKKATLIYATKLPFTIASERSGKNTYAKIQSDFFRNLIADMVRFFEDGKISFDTTETLEVMKIREALIKADMAADGLVITL